MAVKIEQKMTIIWLMIVIYFLIKSTKLMCILQCFTINESICQGEKQLRLWSCHSRTYVRQQYINAKCHVAMVTLSKNRCFLGMIGETLLNETARCFFLCPSVRNFITQSEKIWMQLFVILHQKRFFLKILPHPRKHTCELKRWRHLRSLSASVTSYNQ